jgi:hypothetical protein
MRSPAEERGETVRRKRIAATLGIALVAAGCGSEELACGWQDRPTNEDGWITDWSGAIVTVEDDELTVGTLNDAERIYLYLRPESQGAGMALFAQGFTIWVDGGGEPFGLRFPHEPDPERLGPPEDERAREERRQAAGQRLAESLERVEILDGDGHVQERWRIDDLHGLDLRFGPVDAAPAVQIALALRTPEPGGVGLGAAPGDRIELGLVTPEIDLSALRGARGGRPPGDGPGGGYPGGGGRRGGGGGRRGVGGGMRGGRPEPPEPFDLAAELRLATAPPGSG